MSTSEQAPVVCCGGRAQFPPTRWSVVLVAARRGSAGAEEALAKLCTAYWRPLYAFARGRGNSPEEAEDLTQAFFARLLAKDLLGGIKQEGAKFRSYLLTTFKYFLTNEWHRAHAQKRGNGLPSISLDDEMESHYSRPIADASTPEMLYDRHWALTVLELVFQGLEKEYADANKGELFQALQGCLPGSSSETPNGSAGARLQMSGGALRMATHRLRRRYGELLRAEIAVTVSQASEVDEEIRYLMACLGRR